MWTALDEERGCPRLDHVRRKPDAISVCRLHTSAPVVDPAGQGSARVLSGLVVPLRWCVASSLCTRPWGTLHEWAILADP